RSSRPRPPRAASRRSARARLRAPGARRTRASAAPPTRAAPRRAVRARSASRSSRGRAARAARDRGRRTNPRRPPSRRAPRERAGADVLGDRAEPLLEAEALAHVRLQVDRREVAVVADPLPLEGGDDPLARRGVWEEDDIDEPRPAVIAVVGARQSDPVQRAEKLLIALRRLLAKRQYLVEPLELA